MKEIEEALIILRQRKERQEPNFDFLQKVDDEKTKSTKNKKTTNNFFLLNIFFYRYTSTNT
jgi:hypothetical protein